VEARNLAMLEESAIAARLGSLRGMLQALATDPRRKTVLLMSAGIVTTDRPGGRPDIGSDLGTIVGQDAARANATIYTLWDDTARMSTMSAVSQTPQYGTRDSLLMSAPLDRLTAASGGAMFSVIQGGGEFAFERILKETSAYYLLGVVPDNADRDGRPRTLAVSVDGAPKSATVRARAWVVVPKR
jgi:hypothetical protein